MKKNKVISQQLSINFDENEDNRFQINNAKSLLSNSNSNCKLISFDSYNQKKEMELKQRFYSLSDNLD